MNIRKFVFSPISVNTYIISDDNGKCAVIDCGCYDSDEFAVITEYIDGNDLNPVLLLNTHCHLDHIFGNGMFLQRYNLHTITCREEESNRKNAPVHAQMYGLYMDSPPPAGEYAEDGSVVSFGSVSLEALFVPGHSAGSIAWYCSEHNAVFTGDALFAGGIGRTDLPGGNYEQLINSIKTRILTLPTDTVVYPGHGESTTIGIESATNPWLKQE